ncbi:ASCH domain-containing protein [Streptomyces sp. NPDC019531]|uniref:ASCH domain-containing protein n=1 Tax=Streptomyces sp. NPDC019531 TaxID=3365062 RepID=UPI0038516296
MNTPERALLLSLHPRFATAILTGAKTVELRRQRVAVPPGTLVIIYATSPVMALTGTARLTGVDTAAPGQIWRRHRTNCGISKAEYTAYMNGADHASALLLDTPRPLSSPVPLDHLRTTSAFHPPQSYRYLTTEVLQQLVAGHDAADELLGQLPGPALPAHSPHAAPGHRMSASPSPLPGPLRSAALTAGPSLR